MKLLTRSAYLFSLSAAIIATSASAYAAPKTYQVTGPVIEADNSKIVIKKGNERWEMSRDATTKVTGDLKPGTKATVQYEMIAVNAEAKESKEAKSDQKKKGS
jgi:hypothetical protein